MTLGHGLPHYWDELIARGQGPMKIRFLFQPVVSALFAIRAGVREAREGRRLSFLSVFTDRAHRNRMFRDGWRDVGRVFLIAVGIDLIYQALFLHAFRPGEAVLLGIVLAIAPYLIFRGVMDQILGARSAI